MEEYILMFLLDTDTLVYYMRGNPVVIQHMRENAIYPKAMSVATYGELLFGAYKSARYQENLAKIRKIVELFQVIEVTEAIMETFAMIKASLQKQGNSVEDFDLVIASTALAHNYVLITNNERHYKNIPGLKIRNWATG